MLPLVVYAVWLRLYLGHWLGWLYTVASTPSDPACFSQMFDKLALRAISGAPNLLIGCSRAYIRVPARMKPLLVTLAGLCQTHGRQLEPNVQPTCRRTMGPPAQHPRTPHTPSTPAPQKDSAPCWGRAPRPQAPTGLFEHARRVRFVNA